MAKENVQAHALVGLRAGRSWLVCGKDCAPEYINRKKANKQAVNFVVFYEVDEEVQGQSGR